MTERILEGIHHVRIFTMPDHWQASAAFYRDTMGLSLQHVDATTGIAVFDCGGLPTLSLERVDPGEPEDAAMVGRFTGISFGVEDIDAAYDQLRQRGVSFHGPPRKMDWGGILAHFRDLAGNTLTLVEPPAPRRPRGSG